MGGSDVSIADSIHSFSASTLSRTFSCLSLKNDDQAVLLPAQPIQREPLRKTASSESWEAAGGAPEYGRHPGRRDIRSSSALPPPSPQSSDCGSKRKAKRGIRLVHSSLQLPTPPDSDTDEQDDFSSDNESATSPATSPFPLSPRTLIAPGLMNLGSPIKRQRKGIINKSPHSPLPDRFISDRALPSSPHTPAETFRVSKPLTQLSSTERLVRHNSASPDAFGPLHISRIRNQRLQSLRNRQSPVPQRPVNRTIGLTNVNGLPAQNRQVSPGTIWAVGGAAQESPTTPVRGVSNGRGGWISSGSNAPMHESHFLDDLSTHQDVDQMERRLAAALDLDQTLKVFSNTKPSGSPRIASTGSIGFSKRSLYLEPKAVWRDEAWIHETSFSLLDAPGLRDDFYCTVLAYCHTTRTLAVGLSNRVYLWAEETGVRYPPEEMRSYQSTYVTSLSFSSHEGGHCVLAIGRNNGQISLWSLFDFDDIRFKSQQPNAIACISFKPVTTRRRSERFGSLVATEEMLVGDEIGHVYYYAVEWMSQEQVDIHGWNGHMQLLAKIEVHTQQICGIAWSLQGDFFATGANDNACYLFETNKLLKDHAKPLPITRSPSRRHLQTLFDSLGLPSFISRGIARPNNTYVAVPTHRHPSADSSTSTSSSFLASRPFPPLSSLLRQSSEPVTNTTVVPGQFGSPIITEGSQRHKWLHAAAIKAIAFCPWQRGLLATGGGSNDRAIHFYHVFSGACLATINVHAQVTSLIWSTTRREIAATFGYAQPEHPYRIAVFSWPECRLVVKVPWGEDLRALYAVAFPGSGRGGDGGAGRNGASRRNEREGCVVVASSDETVKFHEVWVGGCKSVRAVNNGLGGSSILEGLGSDGEGEEFSGGGLRREMIR